MAAGPIQGTEKRKCLNPYAITVCQGEQGSMIPRNELSIPLFSTINEAKSKQEQIF